MEKDAGLLVVKLTDGNYLRTLPPPPFRVLPTSGSE